MRFPNLEPYVVMAGRVGALANTRYFAKPAKLLKS
jgi:hypothetical protein